MQRFWLRLLQVLMPRKWISHCQNRRPVYLVLQILWKNTTSMSSYHQSFWQMMQKLGEQLRLFHFSYRSNVSMKPLFLAIFSDNAIVKEHSMTKDKVSYYINYEIVLRDEMLLTCMKRQHTCPGSSKKFLTKYSRG